MTAIELMSVGNIGDQIVPGDFFRNFAFVDSDSKQHHRSQPTADLSQLTGSTQHITGNPA